MADAVYITLKQAKDHLNIATPDGDVGDADLQLKMVQAEGVILGWLNNTAWGRTMTAAWLPDTMPWEAHACILLQLAELWRFRGDDRHDEGPQRNESLDLSPVIVGLLRRLRDPVLA